MDTRNAPYHYEEEVNLKGPNAMEPRLFRPERVEYNYDERSDIPTETYVRRDDSGEFRDRMDSMADSLLDQEDIRNREKEVFGNHYWEDNRPLQAPMQPEIVHPNESEVRRIEEPKISLPPAMAEFEAEPHRREEGNPIDERPIISQPQACQPIRIRPMMPIIRDIVLWRNIKDSAVIFSAGLGAMLALSYFSFITVIAYSSLAVLMLAGGIVFGRQVLDTFQKRSGRVHPFRRHMEQDVVISPEYVHQQVDNILYPINRSLTRMRNLYLADSLAETLKVALYMYILTYIGQWFNLMTLVTIGWVMAFTLPKVYMMYRRQIDGVVMRVRGYMRMGMNRAMTVLQAQRDRIRNKQMQMKREMTEPVVEKKVTVTKVEKVQ